MESSAPRASRGEIITFYSYKGGTGRTMALANVACLLAERVEPAERVLVVDWDLEAPGLHRFFPGRLAQPSGDASLGLDANEGLIDLFSALSDVMPAGPADSEEQADAAIEHAFATVSFDRFITESGIPRVNIVRAGRNDDGGYSRRVNTFNWEELFTREPTIYRRVAERLAERFRYVLIDSRTGVTDISGICTSLLPEKLIVVFTPNRQSVTGIRELVDRATSYRRSSDDLRPLLIYPLPSRIEASLQDLREQWRFGSPDHNLPGYQPMFEQLFAKTYGLERCDLNAYFDDVQIQQTPDYAYGEEIAVRRGSDRFSLANSYRVFVDRLADTPWVAPVVDPLQLAAPSPSPLSPPLPPPPASDKERAGSFTVIGTSTRPSVFLAYAREDRDRVAEVARRFTEKGWSVSSGSDIPAGVSFDQAVADALDASSVVVAFWSNVSVKSAWIRDEAAEGLRRGILLPVLLDDVAPPLVFRTIQAADLRRQDPNKLQQLLEAAERIADAKPGTTIASPREAAPVPAPRPSGPTRWAIGGAIAAGVVLLAVSGGWLLTRSAPDTPAAVLTVPKFEGVTTIDAQGTAASLGVKLVLKDANGKISPAIDGIVKHQSVVAGTPISPGQSIELTVASSSVAVPTVVGKTVEAALAVLANEQLNLGSTTFKTVADVAPGTIVDQKPGAGENVPTGSKVDVIVATRVEPRTASSPRPSTTTRPPNQQGPPVEPAQTRNEYARQRELMVATVLKYKAAYDNRSIRQIVSVYPDISLNEQKSLEMAFGECPKYSGTFDNPQPRTRAGEEVVLVIVTWTYRCEKLDGKQSEGKATQTFQLRPSQGSYLITKISGPLTPK